jgi:ribonuclease BN (tRNA processing enzyme)
METGAKIVLLGTGNPNPDPERSGPSTAIIVEDRAYIIDAGSGVVRRCQEAYIGGMRQLRPDRLEWLFLTHLHSDHTIGLPDLILTPWVMERREPLKIWGPPGTRTMCEKIEQAYMEDIKVRQNGPEKANSTGMNVEVTEIDDTRIFEDDLIKVDAFRVKHGDWKHAFGFRFITDDKIIVISGDCSPTPELLSKYKEADILLHEVYSLKGFNNRSDHWKEYHRSSHTSSTELAEIVNRVRPGKLVLYHQLLWGENDEGLLNEIQELYDGEVYSGKDLEVYY